MGRATRIIFLFLWKTLIITGVSVTLYYMMRRLIPQWRTMWIEYADLNLRDSALVYDFFMVRITPFISWGCAAVAGGVVAGSTLHHLKPAFAWAIWFFYLILLVSDTLIYDVGLGIFEFIFSIKNPHYWSINWNSWSEHTQAATLTFVCSLIGAPLGWMIVRSGVNRHRRKFRKLRMKRRRAQREG